MKQRDFVADYAFYMREGIQKPERSCSAIYYRDGVIYSYGSHYPLLWPVKSKSGRVLLCVNATGYSMTTSKHIGYASMVSDIAIHNTGEAGRTSTEAIRAQIQSERDEAQATYDGKKRKDTQVAAMLLSDIARMDGYLAKLDN
jgi:hypothetical protein